MKELDKAIMAFERAVAKIDAMLAQNNGLKTADDAQNNGKRWFFDTVNQRLASEIEYDFNENRTNDGYQIIEVEESDLPYLEKPEGDWVFKKPEMGDSFKALHGEIIELERMSDQPYVGTIEGYRWVKTPEVAPDVTPEVTDLDGLTVNNKDAVREQTSDNMKFVEYPIFKDDGRYWCNVLHLNGERWDYECALYELPSLVGFAGVSYSDSGVWCMNIANLCGTEETMEIHGWSNDDLKPATPIKARFWIKTPPLNDK